MKRRDMTAEQRAEHEAWIANALADAPPLTPEKAAFLSELLWSVDIDPATKVPGCQCGWCQPQHTTRHRTTATPGSPKVGERVA